MVGEWWYWWRGGGIGGIVQQAAHKNSEVNFTLSLKPRKIWKSYKVKWVSNNQNRCNHKLWISREQGTRKFTSLFKQKLKSVRPDTETPSGSDQRPQVKQLWTECHLTEKAIKCRAWFPGLTSKSASNVLKHLSYQSYSWSPAPAYSHVCCHPNAINLYVPFKPIRNISCQFTLMSDIIQNLQFTLSSNSRNQTGSCDTQLAITWNIITYKHTQLGLLSPPLYFITCSNQWFYRDRFLRSNKEVVLVSQSNSQKAPYTASHAS